MKDLDLGQMTSEVQKFKCKECHLKGSCNDTEKMICRSCIMQYLAYDIGFDLQFNAVPETRRIVQPF